MLQIRKNTYKKSRKLSKSIKVYENISIHKVYVFMHKTGNYSTVLTKSIDKCHYLQTQNNYILALNNSPQLEFVCPQTRPNTQIAQVKIKESRINTIWKNKTIERFKQKTYKQSKNLPQSYNDA